jgi:topoisomerase IA-like protein
MPKAKEAPRADLIEKEPSETHEALAAFVKEQSGYQPDLKTVQLVRVLYRPFIKSEEHQERLESSKEARAQAEADKEKRRQEREANAEAKAAKKTASAGKKTTAKKTAGKKTTAKKTAAADEPF